jgi:hypothetical protein
MMKQIDAPATQARWRVRTATVARFDRSVSLWGLTMASIDTRISPDGKTTYRARTRLKGYPPQSASFASKTKAKQWAAGIEAAMREGRYFTTSDGRCQPFANVSVRPDVVVRS